MSCQVAARSPALGVLVVGTGDRVTWLPPHAVPRTLGGGTALPAWRNVFFLDKIQGLTRVSSTSQGTPAEPLCRRKEKEISAKGSFSS